MSRDDRLEGELVEMAEEQFAAQAPLAELLSTNEAFARWASQVTLLTLTPWSEGEPPGPLQALWEMTDRHDVRLAAIVGAVGWPGRSHVGEDGADAAWVVAQHADRHHDQRRSWLPLLEHAVAVRDADARHLARLQDRVALVDGEPQLFGTYARICEGHQIEWMIPPRGSLADVDLRRQTIGLQPLLDDLREPPNAAPYRYMRTTPAFAWPMADWCV